MEAKNILISVVVLLIVIGGGYWLLRGQMENTQQSTPTNNSSQTQGSQRVNPTTESNKNNVIIEYSAQGFSPNSITVKSGTTVKWINKGSDPMWVASNPHPIHTNLSGFDALKGISARGSYSYTFTKVGKWGYHNHLVPGKIAEVIVE